MYRFLSLFCILLLILISFNTTALASTESPSSSQILADLLENPETREQLIRELRATVAPTEADQVDITDGLVAQIAGASQQFAQQLTEQIVHSAEAVTSLSQTNWQELTPFALELFYIIAATLGAFFCTQKSRDSCVSLH
ncbi:MAG: hypothetical protein LRY63_09735 [Nitrincola sp.]|nr:hypothetical protein [Nitrincola sp.]